MKTIKKALVLVNIKKWKARKRAFGKDKLYLQRLAWAKNDMNWKRRTLSE